MVPFYEILYKHNVPMDRSGFQTKTHIIAIYNNPINRVIY